MMKSTVFATATSLTLATGAVAQDGFMISVDGAPLVGNASVAAERQRADKALAKANVQITFDGLEARPSLALDVLEATPRSVRVGSRLNYPAFVTRGEVLVIDPNSPTGNRIVARAPIAVNGDTSITIPPGDDLMLVHRVYDAHGRYDQTAPRPLLPGQTTREGDFGPNASPEAFLDATATRRIPVHGGAVTARGAQVRPGATVNALGETVPTDPQGGFVMQRILPPGDVPVSVRVTGAGENTYVERTVSIPRAEWFYVGIADATFGKRIDPGVDAAGDAIDDTYSHGRLAGFVKGRTANGWVLTGSLDTGEEALDDLFSATDETDVSRVLERMDPNAGYLEFGDDSTREDAAPTRGKLYLKAEKDGNFVSWGTSKASINGAHFLRNERSLYGLHGLYRSRQTTTQGEARFSFEAYAAEPDTLPGRDTFLGTGGSIYFLQRQDVVPGSETVSVELRDPDTGRVIDSRQLSEGSDYQINAIQGTVALTAPLTGSVGTGVVQTRPGGDYDAQLVVQYEFYPIAGDIDGYSYGARAEGWVTDDLRIGVTGVVEQTDVADQSAAGVDLRYRLGENSAIDLEYAETDGPGFGSSFSDDGGLVITNSGAVSGSGHAARGAVTLDFAEFGSATPGSFSAYYEDRTAGFSTLDHQTSDDETLWGVSIEGSPRETLSWRLYYDAYDDATGKRVNEGGAELALDVNDRVRVELGVEHLDKTTPGGAADETGSRTDVATRVSISPTEMLTWYLFAQATVDRDGGLPENDRYGIGLRYQLSDHWAIDGELSDGDLGPGGAAMLTYSDDTANSAYVGWRLAPGRELSGQSLSGEDRGQYVAGGKRRVNDNVDVYAENTYDLFGQHQSLTGAYGVEYRPDAFWTLTAAYEMGRVDDDSTGHVDRNALSFGMAYSDTDRLKLRARVELRRDRGTVSGTSQDQDAVLVRASGQYKMNEAQRLRFTLDYADVSSDNASLQPGTYTDASIGYALRPVTHDRLNLLFSYRYLYDMIGQEIDGVAGRGPRQESHVVSLDAEYNAGAQWTLGGKIGARWSQSAPDDTTPLAQNDAWLGVLNARYHMTHKWDVLIEGRVLVADQAGFRDTSALAAVYRHVGRNAKVGVGFNFGDFSDDLTDLTYDDRGAFLNLIAKF